METAVKEDWRVKVGRIWFKNRSFSPVPFLIAMLVLEPDFDDARYRTLALIGILVAEALRIWSVGVAGSATRTRGETVPELVTAGPYRYVRNPLYIANIAMYSLCGVVFGFCQLSFWLMVWSAAEYYFIVHFEESILKNSFGPPYLEYCAKVPRWFPSFKPRQEKSDHFFSFGRAIRSEKSTLIAMGVMTLLWIAKAEYLRPKIEN